MSSKSNSSSRHSSPRAMPVETIITRFKSAQLKRQLREMDRSMTKVTELLKNPLKPKVKKKVALKKVQRSNSVASAKDSEEGNRTKKNRKSSEKNVEDEESSFKLKRHIILNKVRLKPKHELKIIGRTNKRKRTVPSKGILPQEDHELLVVCDTRSRDVSPKAKRSKSFSQDMSMDEMIQLIEDSGSLNDEDLLEILTCPSPVWWEDPPNGYIEDALFTRPRSTAEMYPSIRSQLQENLQDRQRSSTPNVLSRRERVSGKRVSKKLEVKQKKTEELCVNNDIDLDITLSKRDEKFIKKRSKLESVLGNLKKKTFNNELINTKDKVKAAEVVKDNINKDKMAEMNNVNDDIICNKVSVIRNIGSNKCIKADVKLGLSVEVNNDKGKASVSMETLSDSTDDERLTDISFQDDNFLNDLENMDIPIQQNINVSPKIQLKDEKQSDSLKLDTDLNKDGVPHFKTQTNNWLVKVENCKTNDFNKCSPIDPTYSNKESSVIEEYFEMKLFEEDNVSKKRKYSKSEVNTVSDRPTKCIKKQTEPNLTSVIKFKTSDSKSINVFKIEGVIPKNLPPLKNSHKRNSSTGRVPESMPPLRRNPGVIHLKSESPTSSKSTTSLDTSDAYNGVNVQDNMDSISDTNICFLSEDEDECCVEQETDNNELESPAVVTVIKSRNAIQTNKSSNDLNHDIHEELSRNDSKCYNNIFFPTNELNFKKDVDLYKNVKNRVIDNELEFQSLTIRKVKDSNCCKVESDKLGDIVKNDVSTMNYDEDKYTESDDLSTIESKSRQNDFNSSSNEIIKIENNLSVCNEIIEIEKENSDCITVYKIISDDSGTEEPKSEFLNKTDPILNKRNLKVKAKDLQDMLKESNYDKSDDLNDKSDNNRDKMIFYFKKCKNLHWKHKNLDKIEDKKFGVEKEMINSDNIKDGDEINKDGNLKLNDTSSSDESEKAIFDKNETNNHNNNLRNNDIKEQKCIIVSDAKQIRYCMKCSSIFDTAQCNYCYRKNTDNKNHCVTDYLLKMEQCYICDVCRYKALSKDSLERHITSHNDSKRR